MAALRNGDSVAVKGTVQEQFDVTRLGNITSPVVRVSGGNQLPAPISLPTGTFSVSGITPSAEMYEGVLVRFDNVRVSDTAATQPDPTEYAVNDGSGAVIVRRDGMNRYSNMAQDAASGKTILKWGDRISSLTGIIYFSNNAYKIVPRTDADFGAVTGVEVHTGEAVPATYALLQNYPNPFNPSSLISYTVPSTVAVTLKVYNLLGQEVATLVNQVQAPGRYTVRFDSSRLSSGVYFYRLQAGSFVALRKMMLVK
jgi:hypothetical protein